MDDVQLGDLLPYYPPQSHPEIQSLIANYLEFSEVAAVGRESRKVPENNPFFDYQELVKRLLMVYDTCLLRGAAGIGKTYIFIYLREELAKQHSYITKAYIFTGLEQIEDFKNQVMTSDYTRAKYETSAIRRGNYGKPSGLKRAITKSIRRSYEPATYPWTYMEVERMRKSAMTPELLNKRLGRRFSGSLLFFDEIQLIKIPKGAKYESPVTRTVKQGEKKVKVKMIGETVKVKKYETIWRIVHLAKRCKVIISTATPVVNSIKELIYIINIFSPLTNQIKTDIMVEIVARCRMRVRWSNFEPQFWSAKEILAAGYNPTDYFRWLFDNFLRGKVIDIAQANINVVPEYRKIFVPNVMPGSKMERYLYQLQNQPIDPDYPILNRVKRLTMRDIQLQTYEAYVARVKQSGKARSSFYEEEFSITTFVFPPISYGRENYGMKGYTDWIYTDPVTNDFRISDERSHDKRLEELLTYDVGALSAKAEFILRGAHRFVGKWYIFTPVIVGSGANIVGLALEYGLVTDDNFNPLPPEDQQRLRFRRFRSRENPFIGDKIRASFPPRNRYAITSRSVDKEEVRMIFKLYNHSSNINGEYLKVIFVSPIGQFGINLKAVAHDVALRPKWNPADLYQSVYRGMRATSHLEIVETIKREGGELPYRVSVDLLACVTPTKVTEEVKGYIRVEKKDKIIAYPTRALKEVSLTGWLLYRRNNLVEYEYGSPECDYTSCEITPYTKPPVTTTDKSNYDILYVEDKIRELVTKTVKYFSTHFSSTIELLSKELGIATEDRNYIYRALLRIIERKIVITNAFGVLCILREIGPLLYVSEMISRSRTAPDFLSAYYSSNMIGVMSKDIHKVASDREQLMAENYLNQILQLKSSDKILEYMSGFSKVRRATIAETFIYKLSKGLLNPATESVQLYEKHLLGTDISPGQVMTLPEPRQALEVTAAMVGTKREATLNKPTWYNESQLTLISGMSKNEGTVCIHCILAFTESKHSVGSVVKTANVSGRLRIYNPKQGYWRDMRNYESTVYVGYFQSSFDRAEIKMREYTDIYGKFLSDGRFRLVDKRRQIAAMVKADRKTVVHGFLATKLEDYLLVEAMWATGFPVDYSSEDFIFPSEYVMRKALYIAVNRGKNERINIIKKGANEEPYDIEYYYIDPDEVPNVWKELRLPRWLLPLDLLKFMYFMLGLESTKNKRVTRERLSIRFLHYLILKGWFVDPHRDALNQYDIIMSRAIRKITDKGGVFALSEEQRLARLVLAQRL